MSGHISQPPSPPLVSEVRMEQQFYLRCLGQPTLYSPSGEAIRFRTKKHLALLVYLALEAPRIHRRERLSEVFWPKVSTAEARHSLATALSVLRPRLGPESFGSKSRHSVIESRTASLGP